MSVKLLTEHHLEFLSSKGGCTGSSESAHYKMPHCWKSHVAAHIISPSTLRVFFAYSIYLGCIYIFYFGGGNWIKGVGQITLSFTCDSERFLLIILNNRISFSCFASAQIYF